MINKVLKFIKENQILDYGDSVILGVSGGADSICLLYVLKELEETLGLKLYVMHVNHHIRTEAQSDADYVKRVCKELGVEFVQVDADIPQLVKKTGMTEEEAGRQVRYNAFYEMVREKNADKIAVAHNLNDNSETVLFHLFRGTGIRGLTGIPVKRDIVVRPLLCCTRDEIEAYLSEKGIGFCRDATNEITEYSRNKIRLELLPYIKENINAKAEYNIVNAAENLEEISNFLDKEAKKAYDEYVEGDVFKKEGFSLHPALKQQIIRLLIKKKAGKLKDITRTHIFSVAALADMDVSKSISLPYELVAERTYDGIWIGKSDFLKNSSPNQEEKSPEERLILNGTLMKNAKFDMEKISLKNSENCSEKYDFSVENIEELVYTKWLDYGKIQGLTLRTRREGDYFIADDKGSRKKLKDYFINEKIPRKNRDEILLLADGSHIVWIIGYRISTYYKVTEDTTEVIKITYKGTVGRTQDKE